jgi:hypothetical protein
MIESDGSPEDLRDYGRALAAEAFQPPGDGLDRGEARNA